jgi:hypothetical protein
VKNIGRDAPALQQKLGARVSEMVAVVREEIIRVRVEAVQAQLKTKLVKYRGGHLGMSERDGAVDGYAGTGGEGAGRLALHPAGEVVLNAMH